MLGSLNRYLLSRLDEDWQRRLRRMYRPARLGSLRRMKPLSECWGVDRGTPVDRYYIERFLAANRDAIRGKVLEVRDSRYALKFGGAVEAVEVLDIDPDNPLATIVADLAAADSIPDEVFDCIILTQTLQYIFDTRAAVRHLHRILRPAGSLLVTVPALSKMYTRRPETDYWRYTPSSIRTLLTQAFGAERVTVVSFGNLTSAIAFLAGMAAEELRARELEHHDPDFPLIIAARCVKASNP
jgi:SAM-dependent methyltransferase